MAKKLYERPIIRTHGDIRDVTRGIKFFGPHFDGIFLDLDGPDNDVIPPIQLAS